MRQCDQPLHDWLQRIIENSMKYLWIYEVTSCAFDIVKNEKKITD